MPECNNCGGFVTRDFTRVFGNNADRVFGCASCATTGEILNAEISSPDRGA